MSPIHYFLYILFHTNPKIIKLVLLEIRLNNISREKELFNMEVRRESYC